jgi:hypothetical protein
MVSKLGNKEYCSRIFMAWKPAILLGKKIIIRTRQKSLKMLREVRRELLLELQKMTTNQRDEFLRGAEEFYKGLMKMEKVRAAIAKPVDCEHAFVMNASYYSHYIESISVRYRR